MLLVTGWRKRLKVANDAFGVILSDGLPYHRSL